MYELCCLAAILIGAAGPVIASQRCAPTEGKYADSEEIGAARGTAAARAEHSPPPAFAKRLHFSGIYPHLATFNDAGECGTGAIVPWAGRLWVITYGQHYPRGSADKLYEIDDELNVTIRPESIGGTPANRMIHRESAQLFIGPYAIDQQRRVRAIPYSVMPGRHTATMRHLTDPANRVYYATMEEGFYEVDVRSLAVKVLYPDANADKGGHAGSLLPGYHGKGAYTGQGVVVYANNGEYGAANKPLDTPSGCLAEWDGQQWTVVRRNQFCEVTGPGGIYGNSNSDDPIWSIGWDHRSLILMLRDGGKWYSFRLPKASHTYDGTHGWYTEWPRIRDIGPDGAAELLMTMHGMFWRFPQSFSAAATAGIRPRSSYLKIIGDFCRWHGLVVFGCDDAARSEFQNVRKLKGGAAAAGQSQSNLWFLAPDQIDRLGPVLGRGAVWVRESVKAGQPSEPYLFAGFQRRAAHLLHSENMPVTFLFEVDRAGNGRWEPLRKEVVGADGYAWIEFPPTDQGEWIRVATDRDCQRATVQFHYSNVDDRPTVPDRMFDGLARPGQPGALGGLVRCLGDNKRTLGLAATRIKGQQIEEVGYYELDEQIQLRRVDDPQAHAALKQAVPIPKGFLTVDEASAICVDDAGRRWRFPKGDPALDELTGIGLMRISREVVTERDLFNCHGTLYELPAENAGGMARVRPIATHNRLIVDYCSYRGLVILTGIETAPTSSNTAALHNRASAENRTSLDNKVPSDSSASSGNRHVIRSADGAAAVWVGVVDDLWKLGKPVGRGGPWKDTVVKAGTASDPYLMTGYDRKTLELSHRADKPVNITVEVDIHGDGLWAKYRSFQVEPGQALRYEFPAAFQAYWIRFICDADCTATAQLTYQ